MTPLLSVAVAALLKRRTDTIPLDTRACRGPQRVTFIAAPKGSLEILIAHTRTPCTRILVAVIVN
jgi:hypothetical protein